MTLELTQEEIVTNLLSSNSILNKMDNCQKFSNSENNLGDYLSRIPQEKTIQNKNVKKTKYTFIQDNLWKF